MYQRLLDQKGIDLKTAEEQVAEDLATNSELESEVYSKAEVEAMQDARFEEIRKSITRRQNTVTHYITTQPILDLCEWSTQRAGERVSWWLWNQKGIDLKTVTDRETDALATNSEPEADSEAQVEVEAEPGVGGEDRSTSSGVSGSSGAEWSRASVDRWES